MPADEKLLLALFARLEERFDRLEDKLDTARMDIAGLKIKASLWGASAGAVLALAVKLLG